MNHKLDRDHYKEVRRRGEREREREREEVIK
jgi:hypothetical protein